MTVSEQRSPRSFATTVLALAVSAGLSVNFPALYTQPGQPAILAQETPLRKKVPAGESAPSTETLSGAHPADAASGAAVQRDNQPRGITIVPYFPVPDEAERHLLAALKTQVRLNFVETPLIDALNFLEEQTELSIHIDRRTLEDEGLSVEEPVNFVHTGISAGTALKLTLDELDLTSVIEDDVLKVTSRNIAAEKQIVRVYPVGDLVIPAEQETWDELTESFRMAIPNARWQNPEGTGGTISTIKAVNSVVIRQTRGAHDQIVRLLESLRAARASEQAR
ncbi:MAG: hypothetical protein VB858_17000 [Planctomycetaceae bacterium]